MMNWNRDGWTPIEECSKDGRVLIVCNPANGWAGIARWFVPNNYRHEDGEWCDPVDGRPTRHAPLFGRAMNNCNNPRNNALPERVETASLAPYFPGIAPSGKDAGSILNEAAGIVGGARNATHGDKERSFQVIANLWNAYLEGRKMQGPITPFDVAQFMVLLKIGRSIQGVPVRDHFVDAAGYSAIAGELAP